MVLRIAMVASELTPFAKTGGLGDVVSALAAFLHREGHDVRVVVPLYATLDRSGQVFTPVDFLQNITIETGRWKFSVSFFTAPQPHGGLPIYFVHCPALYGRETIYGSEWDEHLRFAVLCRAALEAFQRMSFSPDVVHCNDWHTALIPLYLRTVYAWDRLFASTRTVLTLHNMGYQGVFSSSVLDDLGLTPHAEFLYQDDLQDGRINFLKTGLLYATAITTVSRTYAREIQTPEHGMGLDGILRARRKALIGIVNGVDYREWSPENDLFIPHQFSADDLGGKKKNKAALLERMGLPSDEAPVLAIVSRLTSQKGLDLLFDTLPPVLTEGRARLVALGTGDPRYVDFLQWLERTFPARAAFRNTYSTELAHLIEAGADMFLMPSRYEPCGLNQMYSLRYGTVPIVRKTGGLADTVEPHDPERDRGTGFVFDHFTPAGFAWALGTALHVYEENPEAWQALMRRGMAKDYSWNRQGNLYLNLYEQLASMK